MQDRDWPSLRRELLQRFDGGLGAPFPESDFSELALRVFAFQYRNNPAYAAYCDRRGRAPARVDDWRRIPAVPTAGFRELALVSGPPGPAGRVFRTSGTTAGSERRGAHHVPDLALYEASLRPTFEHWVLPDGARLRMLSLLPPGCEAPESSLAHMVSVLQSAFGAPGSAAYGIAGLGVDFAGLEDSLEESEREGEAVCLLGTSFSFVHWLDRLEAEGRRFGLPKGSRLMDTGGYKGLSREVPPASLRERYHEALGIGPERCVNEYGMTELCSQLYDRVLRDSVAQEDPRPKRGPPWLGIVAVDPEGLEPLPDGESGLLRFVDLANLGSVAAVQTEDIGRVTRAGLVLHGRAPGAPARGCSIAVDQLLRAARVGQ